MKLIITAIARKDIQHSIDWENERSSGLGLRFYVELEQRLADLLITPALGSFYYENVRRTTIKTFSYVIHYRYKPENQNIIIVRVLNTRRKPIA